MVTNVQKLIQFRHLNSLIYETLYVTDLCLVDIFFILKILSHKVLLDIVT